LSGATGTIRDAKASFNRFHFNSLPKEVKVECVNLDSFCENHTHPDLIKIDVEGAELQVLNGSKSIFKNIRPAVFFECDNNQEVVFNFFTENGYVLFNFESLTRIKQLSHNNLALNAEKHADLINLIDSNGF
jgi:hypothetical protein